MKNLLLIVACLFALHAKAQVNIDPDHPHIVYWGRVDHTNAKAPAFEFSGVTIRASFSGTSISARLHDYASHGAATTNYYYAIVDGGTPTKFEALAGANSYVLASGLAAGWHTIELIKLTEASVGQTAFLGFVLENGQTLRALENEPACEIEFIGNSITCGYGNEVSIAAEPNTGFHSVNENNYKAWGYTTARNLGMRYRAVSYSGRGMYRNSTGSTSGTLPLIYDRIFPDASGSPTWNHAQAHPDIIVVNLGTNDFALDPGSPLNEVLFKTTYVNFVERLKTLHPNATVVCAVGVMMSDYYPAGAQHWTRIRSYVQDIVTTLTNGGLSKIHYFEMDPQVAPYGEDWHPSAATHANMANKLTQFINTLNVTCSATPPTTGTGLEYTIPNWLDNKKAAVALTFDDWTAGHPAIAVPDLKSRSLPASFYLTVNGWNTINWSQLATWSQEGYEFGNHTKTHSDLTNMNGVQKNDEIRGAKNTIESNLTTQPVLTLAYPFGAYNAAVIDSVKASKHIGARGVFPASGNYTYNFAPTEDDYYKILTYTMDNTVTTTQFSTQINNVVNGGGLLTFMYHSLYNESVTDNSYAPIHQSAFRAQLDALAARSEDVWISTFAQAIQYHKEKKSAVLTEIAAPFAEGNTWKFELSDNLPNELYFQALTLRVKMPEGITNVLGVEQNGQSLSFKIDGDYLQYNAVPDAGVIVVNISGCAVPSVTLLSDAQVQFCAPNEVVLRVAHSSGNTYEWYRDGVAIAGSNADSLVTTTEGIYTIKITNNGCSIESGIIGKSIAVVKTGNCGEPQADFTINYNPALLNQSITLTNTSTNAEPSAVYTWSFGEAVLIDHVLVSTYNGKGPLEIQYQTAGQKTITLEVSGSTANSTKNIVLTVLDKVGCLLSEDFDDAAALTHVGGWNNYTTTTSGSALRVVVPASGVNEWHAFSLNFHEGSTAHTIDFSNAVKKPIVKFRAKASDTLTLTVSLIDASAFVADGLALGAKNKFDITTEYQYFEVDFSGLFFNQWDDDLLDSTQIAAIDFRINSGYLSHPFQNSFGQMVNQPFVGTLEIDWIGVNDDCEVPNPTTSLYKYSVDEAVLKVFPVPTSGTLYLQSSEPGLEWTISTMAGDQVMQGNGTELSIAHLPAGIYLLKQGHVVKKVVKQ
jgi:lysophospholipase L1-like esterase